MQNLTSDITTIGTFTDSALTYTISCTDHRAMTDKVVYAGRIPQITSGQTYTEPIYLNDIISDELDGVNLQTMKEGAFVNDTVNSFTFTSTGGTLSAITNPIYCGTNLYSNPAFDNIDNPGLYITNTINTNAVQYPSDCTLFPLRTNLFVSSTVDATYTLRFRILTQNGGTYNFGISGGTINAYSGMTVGYSIMTSVNFIPDRMKEIWLDLQQNSVTKYSVQIGKAADECAKCFIQFTNENGGISTVPMYGRLKRNDSYTRYTLADMRQYKRNYLVEDTLKFTVNTGWMEEGLGNQLVRQITSSKSIMLYDCATGKSWYVLCDDGTFAEKYFDEEKKAVNYTITFITNKAYHK